MPSQIAGSPPEGPPEPTGGTFHRAGPSQPRRRGERRVRYRAPDTLVEAALHAIADAGSIPAVSTPTARWTAQESPAPRRGFRRSRATTVRAVAPARIESSARCVTPCRDPPAGSAHRVKGRDRRGPQATPGDHHHAEVPAPQALPRRPGAPPSLPADGPVGARGRRGAHGVPAPGRRPAPGERRVR